LKTVVQPNRQVSDCCDSGLPCQASPSPPPPPPLLPQALTWVNFQRSDLDHRIKCTFCKKGAPSRKWTCACELPWHACPAHCNWYKPDDKITAPVDQPEVYPAGPASVRADKRKANTAFPLPPDDIIAEDHRKAVKTARGCTKRKADITLGDRAGLMKRPTVLGPILQQRFGGPCASASSAAS